MDGMVVRKWGAEAGDLFDPSLGGDVEPMLILPEFKSWDLGLILNEREGHTFWQPEEILQFRGVVNGVTVWIEKVTGRYGLNGKSGYRVAFGEHPTYPPMVDVREAARLIKANVPPTEYVKVTPEEWAARHSPSPDGGA